MTYQKHKYNIFPEMNPEEYDLLKKDIQENGYNNKFPITIYQDGVLDGWNRYRACEELGIPPRLEFFKGNDEEAVLFVMQTNKRRNITQSQRAAITIEAEDIIRDIQIKAKENQVRKPLEPDHSVLSPDDKTKPIHTDKILSEMADVGETTIREARRVKKENPEEFEKAKRGEKSFATIARERKRLETTEVTELSAEETEAKEEDDKWAEKQRFSKKAEKLINEINEMPVIYRLRIRQSIKK